MLLVTLLVLVTLSVSSVYGQMGSNSNNPRLGSTGNSGCSPNQVMFGQNLVKKYCQGLGTYNDDNQNKNNYDACIANAVKRYAGDCLRSDDETDDLANVLCTKDGKPKQHSDEVNKRLCCVGAKVENDNEKYDKARAIISECRNKYPEHLF